MLKNLSAGAALVLVTGLSVLVGLGTDQEVLSLLPPLAKMLIPKIIMYSGGATLLYKLKPKDDGNGVPTVPPTGPSTSVTQPPPPPPIMQGGGTIPGASIVAGKAGL